MINRIAILGDFNPAYSTHHALNDSIRQVLKKFDDVVQFDWISTDTFNYKTAFNQLYCGLWIAPGSPYKDAKNVIDTITHVRENNVPTLGNCGGFQYMLIEYARNVCNITNANHEETHPDSKELLISKLSCTLVKKEEQLTIIDKTSILFDVIKKEKLLGKYFCSYGINSEYLDTLKSNGVKLTAVSDNGQVRAFEIGNHCFFLGTLFQPALTLTSDAAPNPLIIEFVQQSIGKK